MSAPFPLVPLGEVLKLERRPIQVEAERLYAEIGIYSYGRGIFHKLARTGFEVGNKDLFLIKEGDFIFQVTFAWEGAVAIASKAEDGMYGSTRFPTFRVNEQLCFAPYLLNYFRTPAGKEQLIRISPGSAGRNRVLSIKRIPEITVPLPPITEQRQIVARIEDLAAKIEEARGLRKLAVEEGEAMLSSASDKAFSIANGKEMGVGNFCEQPRYGYTESATYDAIGPKFLRITDIQNGKVNWSNVPYCVCPEPKKYLLQKGDILFARTGGTIGKSFLIKECPEAVFASYLIRLRVKELVTAEYLYRYFQTPSYWFQITEGKKGTGQPNLNGTKLSQIQVPVPSLDEQRRIVAYLDELLVRPERANS